ncbi:putative permease [Desulfuromusa kysingii]|uniref:Putative permease n=1 Tax=Desulfuromusa kysingii TaxID=37625 RepID=A0A1H3W9L5_9BACT|nr:AI-2E family transporter [Desulfuromusa kysingii]SDZ83813.1 putative permease [Desulfuromusa kysingii]
MLSQNNMSRAQVAVLYLILTTAIASGIAIYSSASTITALLKTATAGLFLPLLISLIVSFLLDPLVYFFEGNKINRTLSIFIVYLLIFSFVGLLLFIIGPPNWKGMAQALKADFPRYIEQAIEFLNRLLVVAQEHFPFIVHYDIAERISSASQSFLGMILKETPRSAMRIGSLLLLVPLFTFFFLRDSRRIVRSLISLTPNRYFEMVLDIYATVSWQLSHFIRGRVLEALIVGLVVWVGLSLTDIRYAPILAVVAGASNLIPYIGPIVGMIPGLVIALADLGMGGEFWWILCVYLLIAQILVDNFILIPILISKVSNLHPLWVILAIVMGGKLYGILGMIIGVPIASIINIVIIATRQHRKTFNPYQRYFTTRGKLL